MLDCTYKGYGPRDQCFGAAQRSKCPDVYTQESDFFYMRLRDRNHHLVGDKGFGFHMGSASFWWAQISQLTLLSAQKSELKQLLIDQGSDFHKPGYYPVC